MNTQRILNAALDCITQFSANGFPLKNVAQDLAAIRKLNSSERPILFELVFRYAREFFLYDQYLKDTVRFSQALSMQEKTAQLLRLCALDLGYLGDEKQTHLLSYQSYVTSLGDKKFISSLCPLIRDGLRKDYGEEAVNIAKGLFARAAKYFAFDHTKISADDVKQTLSNNGISYFTHSRLRTAIGTYDEVDVSRLDHVGDGNLWLMDAGSQMIAELIKPNATDRVLDMCAGEGNKARYIAIKPCQLVAADVDARRLNRAQKRLSTKSVDFVVGDARTTLVGQEFDWIILDAPCTGIGTLRRHPDLMHRITSKMLDACLQLQKELLLSATNLLKPGGILVYATCSLFSAENDQQIAECLRKNSSVKPYPVKDLVGERIKLSSDALCNNSLTLFPHIDDCDGFFVAALKKVKA